MSDLWPSSPLCLLPAEIGAALRHGLLAEAEARIAAYVPAPDDPRPQLTTAAIGYAAAQLQIRRLDNDGAARSLAALSPRFQALGNAGAAALCLGEQALCLGLCHRPDEAQGALLLAEELLGLLPDEERLQLQSLCRLAVGWILVSRGALVEALGVFERALSGASGALRGPCLLGMGQSLRLLSLGDRSARCLEEAAREARGAKDPICEGIALGQLALSALSVGEFEVGHQHALRQVALGRSLGDPAAEARGRVILAEALLQIGRPEDALREARSGLASTAGQPLLQQLYGALVAARATLSLAGATTAAMMNEAEPHLEHAESILAGRDLGGARLQQRACLALLRALRGDMGALRTADDEARAAMRRVPVPGAMADAFLLLSRAFRAARSPLRAAARERRAQLCWELLVEPHAQARRERQATDAELLGPLGRAAQRTLLLRALSYDDEPRPALLVLVRCHPAQRESLLRCATELQCASAGQIGSLLGLVLDAAAPDGGPDARLAALRASGDVLCARVAPLRGMLTDVGEVVLDSAGWTQLLGAP